MKRAMREFYATVAALRDMLQGVGIQGFSIGVILG